MSKHVLVADDSITMRKVIEMVFATEDFHLTTVDNGHDAIARALELGPDLVIADVTMPGKNGYEVCQALRAQASTRAIPVVLLSGTFEAYDDALAKSVGVAGHLTKPFESQALIDKVRQLMGLPPAPDLPNTFTSYATATQSPAPAARAPVAPAVQARSGLQVPPAPLGSGIPLPGTSPALPRMASPTGQQPVARPTSPALAVQRPGVPAGPPLRAMPVAGGPGPRSGASAEKAGLPGAAAPRSPTLPAARVPTVPAARGRDPFGLGQATPQKPVRPNVPGELPGVMGDARPPVGPGSMSLDVGAPSVAPAAPSRSVSDGGEALLRDALSRASREVIEKIAWEVVPQLAETIIREHLERLIKEREAKS